MSNQALFRIGVDLGGTQIKFIVLKDKTIETTFICDTPTECDAILDRITEVCQRFLAEYPVVSIGVGTPGTISDGKITAVNLPFHALPLEALLQSRLPVAVRVDNDANCAALGELLFGTNTQNMNSIALVTLGTGIGGGLIIDRKIQRGNGRMAEFGHIIVESINGLPCSCGQRGCFELYASAGALVRSAEAAAANAPDSALAMLAAANNGHLNGKLFFEALNNGCPEAKKVFDTFLHYLASGINSLYNVLDPDAIILAGGITKQGDVLLSPLKPLLHPGVRVQISELQNDAGALGAAMLPTQI